MSILIRGMEIPKDCVVCPLGWNGCNHQHDFVYMGDRPSDCPLVNVPKHGDLIDRDAFISFIREKWDSYDQWFAEMLEARPTIIPAEEEVYDKYTDTAGNLHWTGTHSGKHIIPAEESE